MMIPVDSKICRYCTFDLPIYQLCCAVSPSNSLRLPSELHGLTLWSFFYVLHDRTAQAFLWFSLFILMHWKDVCLFNPSLLLSLVT